MQPSRRDFLIGLATSGAIAATPVLSHATVISDSFIMGQNPKPAEGLNLKVGFSAIAWNDQDAQAINDVSTLGVPGIQLRGNVVKEFPDPLALRDILAQHHLTFVALSSGTAPLDPAERKSTLESHIQNAKYLRAAGGMYIQIVAASSKSQTANPEDLKYEGKFLTEIGKAVSDVGLQASLHNHMGTLCQTPQELDAILDASDPNYIKLELDTAHYLQGGGDPAKAVHQYAKRLLFLHLKDVKNSAQSNGYEFTELGQGRVDFPALFTALKAVSFDGWGIIELDGKRTAPIRPPMESAQISIQYLAKLGLRV
jgi:inosose dehydratase